MPAINVKSLFPKHNYSQPYHNSNIPFNTARFNVSSHLTFHSCTPPGKFHLFNPLLTLVVKFINPYITSQTFHYVKTNNSKYAITALLCVFATHHLTSEHIKQKEILSVHGLDFHCPTDRKHSIYRTRVKLHDLK